MIANNFESLNDDSTVQIGHDRRSFPRAVKSLRTTVQKKCTSIKSEKKFKLKYIESM